MAAHAEFDPIWRDGLVGRKEAYAWLASQLGIHTDVCHIGMFDEEMCRKVAEICKNRDKSIIQDHNNVESLER